MHDRKYAVGLLAYVDCRHKVYEKPYRALIGNRVDTVNKSINYIDRQTKYTNQALVSLPSLVKCSSNRFFEVPMAGVCSSLKQSAFIYSTPTLYCLPWFVCCVHCEEHSAYFNRHYDSFHCCLFRLNVQTSIYFIRHGQNK